MKNGSTTITQRRGNHKDHLAMFQHRQPSRIFMEKNSKLTCCVFDGISLVSCIMNQPNETITGALYRTQLIEPSKEKRAHYYSRHNKIILLHDNARPHVAAPIKTYLETFNWEVLPHSPYSPDIASSDYHLFRSMTHGLSEQHFI